MYEKSNFDCANLNHFFSVSILTAPFLARLSKSLFSLKRIISARSTSGDELFVVRVNFSDSESRIKVVFYFPVKIFTINQNYESKFRFVNHPHTPLSVRILHTESKLESVVLPLIFTEKGKTPIIPRFLDIHRSQLVKTELNIHFKYANDGDYE